MEYKRRLPTKVSSSDLMKRARTIRDFERNYDAGKIAPGKIREVYRWSPCQQLYKAAYRVVGLGKDNFWEFVGARRV